MIDTDGWIMVSNREGFPVYMQRYKSVKERARAEHTASVLLEFPGFRWARGVSQSDVRLKIAEQLQRAKEARNANSHGETA